MHLSFGIGWCNLACSAWSLLNICSIGQWIFVYYTYLYYMVLRNCSKAIFICLQTILRFIVGRCVFILFSDSLVSDIFLLMWHKQNAVIDLLDEKSCKVFFPNLMWSCFTAMTMFAASFNYYLLKIFLINKLTKFCYGFCYVLEKIAVASCCNEKWIWMNLGMIDGNREKMNKERDNKAMITKIIHIVTTQAGARL